MKKLNVLAAVASVGALVASGAANAATGIDLTPITNAFVASDVTTGVMAVGAVLAVIYVSIKAAKIVLGMLKGG